MYLQKSCFVATIVNYLATQNQSSKLGLKINQNDVYTVEPIPRLTPKIYNTSQLSEIYGKKPTNKPTRQLKSAKRVVIRHLRKATKLDCLRDKLVTDERNLHLDKVQRNFNRSIQTQRQEIKLSIKKKKPVTRKIT